MEHNTIRGRRHSRHFTSIICQANYTRRRRWTPLSDDPNKLQREISMRRVTLFLATLLLALAVMPAADARVVQPPWVVVRWA